MPGKETRGFRILAILSIAELAATYETVMIFVALPTLYRIYGDPILVTWLVTAYLLVGAGVLLVVSRFGDLFGRSRMLALVLAVATAGSLLSACTSHLPIMIAGRALQGVAGAVLPLALGIVRETLPRERMGQGVGLLTGVASIGAGLGLLVGALLVDNFHWRAIFLFSALATALSTILVWVGLPRAPLQRSNWENLDIWGAVLLAPSVAGLTYAISRVGDASEHSIGVYLIGIVSTALLAIWVAHELKHRNPLIDLRLLAAPQIALGNLLMALAGISFFQQTQLLTILMQQPVSSGIGLGLTATLAGALKLSGNVSGMLGGALAGAVSPRRGAGFTSLLGALALTAGWGWLIFRHYSISDVTIGLLFSGLGMVTLYAGAATAILEVAPAGRSAEASGLMAVVRGVCLAIGSQLIALSLSKGGPPGPVRNPLPMDKAYIFTFGWITACAIATILLSILLMRHRPSAAGR